MGMQDRLSGEYVVDDDSDVVRSLGTATSMDSIPPNYYVIK